MNLESYIHSETEIIRLLKKIFSKNHPLVIFDIGACEGEDSIRYSNLFPHARIYAFEANPENTDRIFRNINKFQKNNILVNNFAISDSEGKHEFWISSGCPDYIKDSSSKDWDYGNKSSSLLPPKKVKHTHPWIKFNKKITVNAVTIDGFCLNNNIKEIDYIHMDIQGAELKALNGAKNMISNIKLIWMEVSDIELYKGQSLRKDVENFMLQNNFELHHSNMHGAVGDQLYINKNFHKR